MTLSWNKWNINGTSFRPNQIPGQSWHQHPQKPGAASGVSTGSIWRYLKTGLNNPRIGKSWNQRISSLFLNSSPQKKLAGHLGANVTINHELTTKSGEGTYFHCKPNSFNQCTFLRIGVLSRSLPSAAIRCQPGFPGPSRSPKTNPAAAMQSAFADACL